MRSKHLKRAVSVLLLGVMACQDLPTTTQPGAPESPSYGKADTPPVADPIFYCNTSMRAAEGPNAYVYDFLLLGFSSSDRAWDNSVLKLKVVFQARGERPTAIANCLIPRTASALESAQRVLNVPPGSRVHWSVIQARSPGEDFNLQGCVSDGYCIIDGVTAVAPPPEDPCARGDCWDRGDGEGGGDGSGGGSWGGENPEPDEDGPMVFGACVLAVIGATVSVYVVADAFRSWYDTALSIDRVKRILQMDLEHSVRIAYQLELDRLLERWNDQKSNISLLTGGTALALGVAAVSCAPTMFLPTP